MGLEIKLTDRCNLACGYCYYREAQQHPDLSFEDVKKTIDYFLQSIIPREQEKYPITFFGGEPLLKKDLILRVVDHYQNSLGDHNLQFHICTNGVLLTPAVMEELQRRSVSIYLSLDGAEDVQDTHRVFPDGSGSYTTLSPNMKSFAQTCKAIEQVITPSTAGKLFQSFLFLVENGFRQILAVPDFSAHWTPDLLSKLLVQYAEIAQYKMANPGICFSVIDDKISLLRSGQSYKHFSCNFGRHSFVVATNKQIYPCTRFAQDIQDNDWSIGHIDTGIDQAKRWKLIQEHAIDKSECQDCSIRHLCLGNNCACIAFSLNKDIQYVSPLVCEHERRVFELITDTFDLP